MTSMTPPTHGQYDQETGHMYDATTGRWHPALDFYKRHNIPTYTTRETKMSGKQIALIVGTAIAVLLICIGLTKAFSDDAPSLQSKEQSYLDQASQAVVSVEGDDQLLENGYRICSLLQEGHTPEQISGSVFVTNTDKYGEDAATYQQILQVVRAADTYLC